ncbi:hypothetical protein [Lysobacter sp. cf310]|uniref:hypothetical protein n=1 Tax=Lysobacter sp. cf310 TaxID=1761790 RepID=UPI0008E22F3E|nr:hypothetical protein [Lysobacter sp. cf310]SFL06269.1 hypothetical protein SAMN04487938_3054 [Lysobacter sp. cf310]
MRSTFLASFLFALCAAPTAVAQTPATEPAAVAATTVQTQGMYRSQAQPAWLPGSRQPLATGPTHYLYLRFYPDGRVISVSSTGTPEQIAGWFDHTHDGVSQGRYRIEGDRLHFSTRSGAGSVDYDGRIDADTLQLNSHSHINGRDNTHTLRFVAMPEQP